METSVNQTLAQELQVKEAKFYNACAQVILLNEQLDDLKMRYERAAQEQHASFQYSLGLKMSVMEGVRSMYYQYGSQKADEITALQAQLATEHDLANHFQVLGVAE